MLIFQCFVELITELGNGNQRVDRRDMPVYLANKRSENVNYAPYLYRRNVLKDTIIVQYYVMFLSCQVKMLYTFQ